ncbi:MAG TPA: DUF302 domain-containing protein [Thermoanaerobaculia bacterium]|nr:DUF302 domain-containing protein [Thermoanaerobaculia bacterium]
MNAAAIAYQTAVDLPFTDAVARCREELAKEGFGVLTEIDIPAKLKEKLGVDFPPYLILGACHPPSAHRSLQAAPEVGVLLPCNVTVSVEGGRTIVRAMNPDAAMQMIDNPEVAAVATEVGAALRRVLAGVAAASPG